MQLHIGLDGSRLAETQYTGTEHYTYHLFCALFRIAPHHRYTIYAHGRPSKALATGTADVNWRVMPFPRFWTQLRLSWEFLTQPHPDVLFIPAHTAPLISPRHTVITIHDLAFLHIPSEYSLGERLEQRWALWQATRKARRLIAVSEATGQDLIDQVRLPAERVKVVYHGVDLDTFRPPTIREQPTPVQRATQPYLYSIGRLERKKNTAQLIRAFRILKERHHLPHQLVLAGKPGRYGYDEISTLLAELPELIRNDILLLGYVSDQEHAAWLRFSESLVFPSLFEGFGMPVLEAMASGVPVVTSRTGSLAEVAGEAAVLVNPTQAASIAQGVLRLANDESLRNRCILRGRERAAQFTWERAARETINILEDVARGPDQP
ncbi:glycosyltransferase family 4 protein [Candidatus Berkelbacteria bacterium]|nr:glycosyltransferase family 4 protein [Candidatus Berkelbacteria bacterium]